MENFIVSARKYRPVTFASVVGQLHITNTLKNAIKNNQLAQAFLFCGPRGVGKTTCARILAKTVNCENVSTQIEACGECESCRSFQNGNSFSIHELDAASNNSVEDIRSLIEQVRIPPQTGKCKIYIIDEVHMLSQAAFNAFLKTLEEPPSYAIFILATTEKHKILPTILSRCQIFDFNRIKVDDMAQHLAAIGEKEGIAYEMDGLHVIAQKADGGLRDALSMFDQIVSFSNKHITYQSVIDNLNILDYDYYFKLLDAIAAQNATEALLVFDQVLNNGFDGGHFISGLSNHLRDLLVSKEPSTLKLLEVGENIKSRYLAQSKAIETGLLLSSLNVANQCEINYRNSKNQRLQVELALLKMCHISTAIRLSLNPTSPASEDEKKKITAAQPNPTVSKSPVPPSKVGEQPSPAILSAKEPVQPIGNVEGAKGATASSNTATTTPTSATPPPAAKKGWGAAPVKKLLPDLDTFLEEKNTGNAEVELVNGNEFQAVDPEVFQQRWNEYANKMHKESKITVYTIMKSFPPVLNGAEIVVQVENMVQLDELKVAKVDILNYLRVVLKNYSLQIKEVMMENIKVRKPYTAQEKYQAMVEKNPALEALRKKLNLGLT